MFQISEHWVSEIDAIRPATWDGCCNRLRFFLRESIDSIIFASSENLTSISIMKKFFLALIAVLCCAVAISTVSSCNKNDKTATKYSFGFNNYSGNASATFEASKIERTFKETFETKLGVTPTEQNEFVYEGGDDKVIEACQAAKAELISFGIVNTFTFVVERYVPGGANVVIFTLQTPLGAV